MDKKILFLLKLFMHSYFNYEFFKGFKSFSRAMLYQLYRWKILKYRNSNDAISLEYVFSLFDDRINIKIPKSYLYEFTGMSKNTFNKYFKLLIDDNGLKGRRSFSLSEVYLFYKFWFGDGELVAVKALRKGQLTKYLHDGDYKKFAKEFELFLSNSNPQQSYKEKDYISPDLLRKFIDHIDLDELERETLMENIA